MGASVIRDSLGDESYWRERVKYRKDRLERELDLLRQPSKKPVYDPQYSFDHCLNYVKLILTNYSAGVDIGDAGLPFSGVLDAWELSNGLANQVCSEYDVKSCRDWDFNLENLNHYNWCFGLVGLALAFGVSDEQWLRLLALIGGEGEDTLLDRVIASRQFDRKIGPSLLHPKPYARLLSTIDAPSDQQASLLLEFVVSWYVELKRPAPRNKKAPTIEPYWYVYGDPDKHPLAYGSYFGHWCLEAVAAVKAFGIDDSLCLGHENYPGDLLRPNGPTTHKPRSGAKKGWLSKLLRK